MKRISLAEVAHQLVKQHVVAGDKVIDATVGNGHDTLFLAQIVGFSGAVFGFDIQQQALLNTRQRLQQHQLDAPVRLIQASHADMPQHIPQDLNGCIAAIMFNLGYLPGADKRLTTQTETTLRAIEAACDLLAEQGVMTVMVYPGHVGGGEEAQAVMRWFQSLASDKFAGDVIDSQHPKPHSPRLFVIRKQVGSAMMPHFFTHS